jgi:peptidoglycan/LPS O-acetylase OafA/YrhL
MAKKLLLLNGLAILAIPIHHATAYGLSAMFEWTDRYLPVTVPNYDLLGSIPYYVIVVLRQLDIYAVPAFLFISGYFIAFSVRGKEKNLSYKTILPRIKILLIPFVIWTGLRYIMLRRLPTSIDDLLNPYHFIPLLIQFYLLAPFLVILARKNWKLLLILAATLQLSIQGMQLLQGVGIHYPITDTILTLSPRWLFYGQQPFWFPFGLVFGLYGSQWSKLLNGRSRIYFIAVIIFGILSIGEYFVADQLNGALWIGPTFPGVFKNFYILAVLLLILAIDEKTIPGSKEISNVGTHSLGIYLANIPFVYLFAFLMYHLTPQALGAQFIYMTILFIVGLGGPLLLMWFVRRSRARKSYRYLFG